MLKKRPILRTVLLVLIVVVAGGPTAFVAFGQVKVVPRLEFAPGFSALDPSGERLTSDGLKGGLTLYAFGYPGCGERCEPAARLFREVRDRLDEIDLAGIPVRFVTLSFSQDSLANQPAGAANPLLGDWAAAVAGTPEMPRDSASGTWTVAALYPTLARRIVVEGFGVYYEPMKEHLGPPPPDLAFDPGIVLVDQVGIKRREYLFPPPTADKVLRDLSDLATEAQADGFAHLAFEAAHFLSCYSQ